VSIRGSCTGQPITVEVLNESGNPAANARVKVVRNRITQDEKITPENGKVNFMVDEPGEYLFYTTKNNYNANSNKLNISDCAKPRLTFEANLDTETQQTMQLLSGDGNAIRDFNVFLTLPDNSVRVFSTNEGSVVFPVELAGTYSAIVKTEGFEQAIEFRVITPNQVVPPINPEAEPVVSAVLGEETVQTPNYLIIWILAIAVISGLIIEVTKLKPGWFRVFMATTYTSLPIVVNYYTQNIWLSFTIIAIQTVILTAKWFQMWRKRRKEAIGQVQAQGTV